MDASSSLELEEEEEEVVIEVEDGDGFDSKFFQDMPKLGPQRSIGRPIHRPRSAGKGRRQKSAPFKIKSLPIKRAKKADHERSYYACYMCDASFPRLSEYLAHIRMHQEENTKKTGERRRKTTTSGKHAEKGESERKRPETILHRPPASWSHAKLKFFDLEADLCYHCRECGKCFKEASCLKRHKKSTHPIVEDVDVEEVPGTFDCNECEISFNEQADLTEHMLEAHQEEEEGLPCESCGKSFQNKSFLDGHVKNVHGIIVKKEEWARPEKEKPKNNYFCSICEIEPFETKIELAHHVKLHHTPRVFKCFRCNMMFSELKNLRTHERSTHNRPLMKESRAGYGAMANEAQYICDLCTPPRAFQWKDVYEYHVSEGHSEGAKKWRRQYGCPDCGELFQKMSDMREHQSHVHGTPQLFDEEQAIRCSDYSDCICEETFLRPHALSDHLLAAHGLGHPHSQYTCYICQKPFQTKCGLNNHVESTHSARGRMPFECQHCGRRYATKHNWRKHMKSHVEGNEFYICEKCGNRYLHSNSLQFHERTCTGPKQEENPPAEPEFLADGSTVYPCDICGNRMSSLRSLKNHRRAVHWIYSKPRNLKITTSSSQPMFAVSPMYQRKGRVGYDLEQPRGYKTVLSYSGRQASAVAIPTNVVDHDYLDTVVVEDLEDTSVYDVVDGDGEQEGEVDDGEEDEGNVEESVTQPY